MHACWQEGRGDLQLDLAVEMRTDGQALQLTLEFNADVFPERIADHYLVRPGATHPLHVNPAVMVQPL